MNLLLRSEPPISLWAGMLLTLVRHACVSRQNKFEVHVPDCRQSCRGHVHRYSAAANGSAEDPMRKQNRQARQESPSAGRSHAPVYLLALVLPCFRDMKVISLNLNFSASSGRSQDPLAPWWRNLSSNGKIFSPNEREEGFRPVPRIYYEVTLNLVYFDGTAKVQPG